MLLCICLPSLAAFSNFPNPIKARLDAAMNNITTDITNVETDAKQTIDQAFQNATQKITSPLSEIKSKMDPINLQTLVHDVEKGPKKLIHAAKEAVDTLIKKAKKKVKKDIQDIFEAGAEAALNTAQTKL